MSGDDVEIVQRSLAKTDTVELASIFFVSSELLTKLVIWILEFSLSVKIDELIECALKLCLTLRELFTTPPLVQEICVATTGAFTTASVILQRLSLICMDSCVEEDDNLKSFFSFSSSLIVSGKSSDVSGGFTTASASRLLILNAALCSFRFRRTSPGIKKNRNSKRIIIYTVNN